MPINVICPNCHARFTVSEKFAGQEGPCPKCKGKIRVPKLEEQVVIHSPENYGPKGVSGAAVLKPLKRQETKWSLPLLIGSISVALLVPIAAFVYGRIVRGGGSGGGGMAVGELGIAALLIAPPIILAAYSFLRNAELEPYRGLALSIRVGICSLVYAGLWGLHLYLKFMLLEPGEQPELLHVMMILPAMLIPGALAALATLDLDATNAGLHCGVYLGACVLLRVIAGLPAF